MDKKECKSCENFDLSTNECLIDGSIGYENQACLHSDCEKYSETTWFVPDYFSKPLDKHN